MADTRHYPYLSEQAELATLHMEARLEGVLDFSFDEVEDIPGLRLLGEWKPKDRRTEEYALVAAGGFVTVGVVQGHLVRRFRRLNE